MIKLGLNDIGKIYLGEAEISKAYIGTGLVFSSGDSPTPQQGYITNGLAFHLDGLERGGVAGHWIDKVGNVDFTLTNCTENADNVQFSTSLHSTAAAASIGNFQSNVCTIEAVLERDNTKAGIFTTPTNGGICLVIHQANNQIGFNATGRTLYRYNYTSSTHTGKQILSVNDDAALCNGVALTRNSTNTVFVNSTVPTVGSFTGSYGDLWWFNGKIYAIRIYNRKLTQEEMLQNQQVDNERFNLGLTITT